MHLYGNISLELCILDRQRRANTWISSFHLQMFRGIIKYVAFFGVLVGIAIITRVLEQVVEKASPKGELHMCTNSDTTPSKLNAPCDCQSIIGYSICFKKPLTLLPFRIWKNDPILPSMKMKGTVVGSKVLFANFPSFNGNIQNFAGH